MSRRDGLRTLLLAATVLATAAAWAGPITVTVTDATGQPLADAVVQLDSAAAEKLVKPAPVQSIVQRQKTFLPAVTVVPRGTAVAFPNEDTVRHHVYSFSSAKRFELKLYAGTPASPVVFDQPGIVVLGCNIHDHMIAWVHVVNTPYYGVTDGQGRVMLPQVAPGQYQLKTWHPRLPDGRSPPQQTVQVTDASMATTVRLEGLTPP